MSEDKSRITSGSAKNAAVRYYSTVSVGQRENFSRPRADASGGVIDYGCRHIPNFCFGPPGLFFPDPDVNVFSSSSELAVGGTHFLDYARSRTREQSTKCHDTRVMMDRLT